MGPNGELSRGGLGVLDNLDPYQAHTTEELNVMPLGAGAHTLTIEAWQDGNVQASASHDFTVQ